MPELPDVQGFMKYVDATSLHQTVNRVTITDERILKAVTPDKLRAHLEGAQFTRNDRHGKYLFTSISKGGALVVHFGMTGSLAYGDASEDLPDYSRVTIEFENHKRLSYISRRMLGEIGLSEDPARFIERHGLGPDALAPELNREEFVKALTGRRGRIKSALMNQSIVAGIGNVYSDEILFQARVRPDKEVNRLDEETIANIFDVMRRVLSIAAERGGDLERLPSDWLLPHVEAGDESCPGCGGKIIKTKIGGRPSHYCPDCQTE